MPKIYAECHADTQLAKYIFVDCDVEHISGHGTTLNILRETKDQSAIALIDKSKNLGSFFSTFKESKSLDHGILLKEHETGKKLIYLSFGLEQFIIDLCYAHKINLSSYNLPVDLKNLCTRLKSIKVDNDLDFRNLINTIKQKHIPIFLEIKNFIGC